MKCEVKRCNRPSISNEIMIRPERRSKQTAGQLWRRLRVIFIALHKFWATARYVQIYGSSRHHYTLQTALSQFAKSRPSSSFGLVLLRTHKLRIFWSGLIYLLLLWTCTVSVFVMCFLDIHTQFWLASESCLTCICVADVFVSLFSAYKDQNHVVVTDFARIRRRYVERWLVPDLLAW